MFYPNENVLIEKFAVLVEEGKLLNEQAVAEQTMDIMMLLSTDPSLCDTIIKINQTLQGLIRCAPESYHTGPTQVAQALRKLKACVQVHH